MDSFTLGETDMVMPSPEFPEQQESQNVKTRSPPQIDLYVPAHAAAAGYLGSPPEHTLSEINVNYFPRHLRKNM
jgi:hypothetical protein